MSEKVASYTSGSFCIFETMEVDDLKRFLALTRGWCSRRDRCTAEVRQRLTREGATTEQCDAVIQLLKDEHYLDDQRFASAFVSGHFRIKQWGRKKIRYALKGLGVDDSTILHALQNDIDDDEYLTTLYQVLDKKLGRDRTHPAVRQKAITHAMQRGFESDLIFETLAQLTNENQ